MGTRLFLESQANLPSPQLTEDTHVEQFGYKPSGLHKTFSLASNLTSTFAFVSITSSLFTSFGFLLKQAGPAGLWSWLVAFAGYTALCLVFAMVAARLPLSGFTYQAATRLAHPALGTFIGWITYAYNLVALLAIDVAFVSEAFMPLIGVGGGEQVLFSFGISVVTVDTLVACAALLLQAALLLVSTRIVSWVNTVSVVVDMLGLTALVVAGLVFAARGAGSFANVLSTGSVPHADYFAWMGPAMTSVLLGAYGLVGFENAASIAEETRNPQRSVPRSMIIVLVVGGVVGFLALFALVIAIPPDQLDSVTRSAAPVASILYLHLGPVGLRVFLAYAAVAMFVCGLSTFLAQTRIVWAMSRDQRFPGYQLFARVHSRTGTPALAVLLGLLLCIVLLFFFSQRLVDLFTASTQLPALYYLGTLAAIGVGRLRGRLRGGSDVAATRAASPPPFRLPRAAGWILGLLAAAWLVFELLVLFVPPMFHRAALYSAAVCGVGLLWVVLLALFHRPSLRPHEPAELPPAPPTERSPLLVRPTRLHDARDMD